MQSSSNSLQVKTVMEKTKTKLSFEKYQGVLAFEVLVFDFFKSFIFLANNLGLDEKVHILVKMVGAFSHTGRCRQDNGQNCLTVVHLYSQDFWKQSRSYFLVVLVFEVLVFDSLKSFIS